MRVCPICGGEGAPHARFRFWAEYRFDLRWCESCEVGWVPELPDSAVFADAPGLPWGRDIEAYVGVRA